MLVGVYIALAIFGPIAVLSWRQYHQYSPLISSLSRRKADLSGLNTKLILSRSLRMQSEGQTLTSEYSLSSFPFQWRGMVLTLPNTDFGGPVDGGDMLFEPTVTIASSANDMEDSGSFLPTAEDFELPMLPESDPVFPGSRSFLFINEMKFRCLFGDMSSKFGNRLVRAVIDKDTGEIAPIAVVCKVVEVRRFQTGEAAYVILGLYRVNIRALRRRDPYVTCMVKALDPIDPPQYDQNVDKPRAAKTNKHFPCKPYGGRVMLNTAGAPLGTNRLTLRDLLACEKLSESIYKDLTFSLRLLRTARTNRGVVRKPPRNSDASDSSSSSGSGGSGDNSDQQQRSSGILRTNANNRGKIDQKGVCLFPVLYQNRPIKAVVTNPNAEDMDASEAKTLTQLTDILKYAIEHVLPVVQDELENAKTEDSDSSNDNNDNIVNNEEEEEQEDSSSFRSPITEDGVDLTLMMDRHRAFSYAVCSTLAAPNDMKQNYLRLGTLQRLQQLEAKVSSAKNSMLQESLTAGIVDEEDVAYLQSLDIGDDDDVKPPSDYQLLSIALLNFDGYDEVKEEDEITRVSTDGDASPLGDSASSSTPAAGTSGSRSSSGASVADVLMDDVTYQRQRGEQGGAPVWTDNARKDGFFDPRTTPPTGTEPSIGNESDSNARNDNEDDQEEEDPWSGNVLQ